MDGCTIVAHLSGNIWPIYITSFWIKMDIVHHCEVKTLRFMLCVHFIKFMSVHIRIGRFWFYFDNRFWNCTETQWINIYYSGLITIGCFVWSSASGLYRGIALNIWLILPLRCSFRVWLLFRWRSTGLIRSVSFLRGCFCIPNWEWRKRKIVYALINAA